MIEFSGYLYKKDLKNWKGTIHNGQLFSQNLKEKRKEYETRAKDSVSDKFNDITR